STGRSPSAHTRVTWFSTCSPIDHIRRWDFVPASACSRWPNATATPAWKQLVKEPSPSDHPLAVVSSRSWKKDSRRNHCRKRLIFHCRLTATFAERLTINDHQEKTDACQSNTQS